MRETLWLTDETSMRPSTKRDFKITDSPIGASPIKGNCSKCPTLFWEDQPRCWNEPNQ